MLNFPTTPLASSDPNMTSDSVVSQNSNLHILNWPHDILRFIGRMLPRNNAITFTSTCVLLFTLRFKAGGHGILYEQCWKRVPMPREAIYSMLNLESRTTAAWASVKNYATAISTLTLNFTSLSLPELASVTADLKNLATLTTLTIKCPELPKELAMALLLTVCQFSTLQSLLVETRNLTTLPTELWRLERLQSLTINMFTLTILPAELGQLHNLQSLTIQMPKLTIMPTGLAQLQRLQSLKILVHHLTILPAELLQLKHLQSLAIGTHSTLSTELWQLEHLQSLTIQMPKLTILPAELGQLHNLQSLKIIASSLTLLPAELGELKNLKNLILYTKCLITLPTNLNQLNSLQSLTVKASSSFILPPAIECLKKRGVQINVTIAI